MHGAPWKIGHAKSYPRSLPGPWRRGLSGARHGPRLTKANMYASMYGDAQDSAPGADSIAQRVQHWSLITAHSGL